MTQLQEALGVRWAKGMHKCSDQARTHQSQEAPDPSDPLVPNPASSSDGAVQGGQNVPVTWLRAEFWVSKSRNLEKKATKWPPPFLTAVLFFKSRFIPLCVCFYLFVFLKESLLLLTAKRHQSPKPTEGTWSRLSGISRAPDGRSVGWSVDWSVLQSKGVTITGRFSPLGRARQDSGTLPGTGCAISMSLLWYLALSSPRTF